MKLTDILGIILITSLCAFMGMLTSVLMLFGIESPEDIAIFCFILIVLCGAFIFLMLLMKSYKEEL
jgi:hypothetical protein